MSSRRGQHRQVLRGASDSAVLPPTAPAHGVVVTERQAWTPKTVEKQLQPGIRHWSWLLSLSAMAVADRALALWVPPIGFGLHACIVVGLIVHAAPDVTKDRSLRVAQLLAPLSRIISPAVATVVAI
jgi:hypothetical protein